MKVISGKWSNVGIIVAWQSNESCLHQTKHLTLSISENYSLASFFKKDKNLRKWFLRVRHCFFESCCRSLQVFSSCEPC